MYFAASCILEMIFSLSSNTGDFVVINPRTTFLSGDTLARGANPPERVSSYSKNKAFTFSFANT